MIRAEPFSSLKGGDGFIGQFHLAMFWRTVRNDNGTPTIFPTEQEAVEAARAEWNKRFAHSDSTVYIPRMLGRRRRAA